MQAAEALPQTPIEIQNCPSLKILLTFSAQKLVNTFLRQTKLDIKKLPIARKFMLIFNTKKEKACSKSQVEKLNQLFITKTSRNFRKIV